MSLLEKLPTEIRTAVWFYTLVSPTGYLEPVGSNESYCLKGLNNHHPRSHPRAQFYLKVTTPADRSANREHYLKFVVKEVYFDRISTSIIRTNKKIRSETAPIFWHNNTFLFYNDGNLWRFKEEGIVPFSLVTSVNIILHSSVLARFDQPPVAAMLKELRIYKPKPGMSLKKLELSISVPLLDEICSWTYGTSTYSRHWDEMKRMYVELLHEENCSDFNFDLEKSILVLEKRELESTRKDVQKQEVKMKDYEKVMEDLHRVFGGKLRVGQKVLWNEGKRVGYLEKDT